MVEQVGVCHDLSSYTAINTLHHLPGYWDIYQLVCKKIVHLFYFGPACPILLFFLLLFFSYSSHSHQKLDPFANLFPWRLFNVFNAPKLTWYDISVLEHAGPGTFYSDPSFLVHVIQYLLVVFHHIHNRLWMCFCIWGNLLRNVGYPRSRQWPLGLKAEPSRIWTSPACAAAKSFFKWKQLIAGAHFIPLPFDMSVGLVVVGGKRTGTAGHELNRCLNSFQNMLVPAPSTLLFFWVSACWENNKEEGK